MDFDPSNPVDTYWKGFDEGRESGRVDGRKDAIKAFVEWLEDDYSRVDELTFAQRVKLFKRLLKETE